MKKTPFVTVNLKKSVYIIKTVLFAAAIAVTSSVSRAVRPIPLGTDLTNAILSSGCGAGLENKSAQKIPAAFFRINTQESEASAEEQPKKKDAAVPPAQSAPAAAQIKAVVNTAPQKAASISNETKSAVNIDALTSAAPGFLKEKCSVLIMHTHTSESYTPSEAYSYTPSDTDRTLDKNYNMVRVGKEIKQVLEGGGIKVYHDTTVNDYPSYNGSYNRSSVNVQNYISNDPSIKIVLDIHRDAIEGTDGEKIKHICSIDGRDAACIMFVVGTNQSGLKHDNWKTNMSFALLLQEHINKIYPDLCRPINLRKQRFNQQLAPGAIIVEIGTNGNTLDEALLGANSFAKGLLGFLNEKN